MKRTGWTAVAGAMVAVVDAEAEELRRALHNRKRRERRCVGNSARCKCPRCRDERRSTRAGR